MKAKTPKKRIELEQMKLELNIENSETIESSEDLQDELEEATIDVPDNDLDNLYYVYMILCEDASIYTGYTKDPVTRFQHHCLGVAAKYTRSHVPLTMHIVGIYKTQGDAMRIEKEYKMKSTSQKRGIYRKFERRLFRWQVVRDGQQI